MKVKIISKSGKLPEYATENSSGMDLRYYGKDFITIKPGEIKLIPTGISVELEPGYEIQIRPRSGLSLNKGLIAILGTIDSDYRGDLGVILINLGNKEEIISPGDRIAQIVCVKVEKMELIETNSLSDTERGTGGFGHSGIK